MGLSTAFKMMFRRWDDRPKDQSFYVKMLFATISAIVCGLNGVAFAGVRGVLFGFLVYTLSLFVIVYVMDIDPSEIGGRQKLVTDSLASYLLLWILLWTLIYVFVAPARVYERLLVVIISHML